MCEPTTATLAYVAIAASVAGTAVSIYAQQQAGDAANKQAQYAAAVARNNSILAERSAEDAEARGKIEETNHATQVAQLVGRQRAVLGSNGVQVDSGSALDITSDTVAQGRYDELTIRNNADREALGFRTQGMNFDASAGLDLAKGEAAQQSALFGSVGTALSGAGSVAGKWYSFNKQGTFGAGVDTNVNGFTP